MDRDIGISDFLNSATELVKDNSRNVGIYILVVGALGAAGVALGFVEPTTSAFQFGEGVEWQSGDPLVGALFQLVVAVISVVAAYFLLAEFLAARGRLPDRSTRIWAYVGMSILAVIGLVFGLLLLVIPGIILMVRWVAASGFLIGGRKGIVESLSSSWHATSGHGMSIFLAALVLIIALIVVSVIFGVIIGLVGGTDAADVLTPFVQALANAVFLAFGIGAYTLVADDTEARE